MQLPPFRIYAPQHFAPAGAKEFLIVNSDDMRVGIYSLRGARVAATLMGGKARSGAHLPLKKAAQPPFSMLKNAGLSPAFLK